MHNTSMRCYLLMIYILTVGNALKFVKFSLIFERQVVHACIHVKKISVIMCLDALYALSRLAPALSVKQSKKNK